MKGKELNEYILNIQNGIINDLKNDGITISNPFSPEAYSAITTLAMSQLRLDEIKRKLTAKAREEVWIGYPDGETPVVVSAAEIEAEGVRGAKKFIKRSVYDELVAEARLLAQAISLTLHADRVVAAERLHKYLESRGV